MFGKVSIQMKLVEGDSAGTVTAFYVSTHFCLSSLLKQLCGSMADSSAGSRIIRWGFRPYQLIVVYVI